MIYLFQAKARVLGPHTSASLITQTSGQVHSRVAGQRQTTRLRPSPKRRASAEPSRMPAPPPSPKIKPTTAAATGRTCWGVRNCPRPGGGSPGVEAGNARSGTLKPITCVLKVTRVECVRHDHAPPGATIHGASVLVTGGNRGFGLALVNAFLDRGAARVYATSRSAHTHPNHRVVPLVVDVTDDAAVREAARVASDVSILVNNAGVSLRSSVLDAPLDDIRAELDTNLFGIIRVARAFAPVLAEHATSSLVNVLSALAWISLGRGYEISKSAAWSATNALRVQLAPLGTRVTAVHVGYMDTDMVASLDVPKADPRDVARQTLDAIEAGAFEVLADETARRVKSALAGDVAGLYPQLRVPTPA